jgi:hypothetical protein
MADPHSSRTPPRRCSLPSNIEDFCARLDSIEIDLRHIPPNLRVLLTHTPLTEYGARYSLFECGDEQRLGTHWRFGDDIPEWGRLPNFDQATDRFPFGVVFSRTTHLLELAMDAERPWLNFGGKCGFYASGTSVRDSVPEGKVSHYLTERTIWHYFDEGTGHIPKTSSFASVYEQLSHCYRGIKEACSSVDDLVWPSHNEFTPDMEEWEWPEILLYLGLKNSPRSLRVTSSSVPRILKRDFAGSSFLDHPEIPFDDPTEDWQRVFSRWHKLFIISPSSVVKATRHALNMLRSSVLAIDGTAVSEEAMIRTSLFPSRSITAYDDEVMRAAADKHHPSVDFLEPLAREIESILHSDQPRIQILHKLRLLFWDLTNAEVPIVATDDPNCVLYRSDERLPLWERSRAFLMASGLAALCDDFIDRTVKQKEAIESLWRAVKSHSASRQLTATDLSDLRLDAYIATIKSLSRTLRQHSPVKQTRNNGASAGANDPKEPKSFEAASKKGNPEWEYLRSVPHIIQILKDHHLNETGKVDNPGALGFNEILRRLKKKHPVAKRNHVAKFFERQFSRRGKATGWQIYEEAFAGSGNESTLLAWLKRVDTSAADAIIESAVEASAEAAGELPPANAKTCECGRPLLLQDEGWGECEVCRLPKYR